MCRRAEGVQGVDEAVVEGVVVAEVAKREQTIIHMMRRMKLKKYVFY